MVIQELKPSQRVQGRWLAMLEDGSILRVGQQEIADFALYSGRELTEEETEALTAGLRRRQLRERALELLSRKPQSRRELTRKLNEWGAQPEEADAVAIAGMGGETIAESLAAAPWTRERDVPLVLQPMSSMDDLRLWLERHGYAIVKEDLAREGDVLYTALLVRAGAMEPLTAAERLAGKNTGHPLRGAWLDRWLDKTDRSLNGLAQSQKPEAAARREELEQLEHELRDMKKEWEAWQR